MDEKTRTLLANVHNMVSQLHVTGDDILIAATIITEIRKAFEESTEEGEQ